MKKQIPRGATSLLLALLLLGLALQLGCKKDPKKFVAGRVLEHSTEKPIADARVFLTECEGELLAVSAAR
jgi:hypothetical protein